jgi:hypothetical protein
MTDDIPDDAATWTHLVSRHNALTRKLTECAVAHGDLLSVALGALAHAAAFLIVNARLGEPPEAEAVALFERAFAVALEKERHPKLAEE